MKRRFSSIRSLLFVGVVVGVVAISGCSSGATKSTGTSTTTAATTATTSVGDVATTVAGAATTIASAATTVPATTIAEPTSTVAGILEPAKNIPTGWVAGAQPGDPIVGAAAGACQSFYDALAAGPYTQSRCGVWAASDGDRTWTVTRGASGFLIAIIWQQTSPNNWAPVLRAPEETAGQWSDIVIVTGNTDTGPGDELVAGTRIAGASGKLAISLIDIRSGAPKVVAVHPTGNHGVAVLRLGVGVEVWSAVQADNIPKCCPTMFTQGFLVFIDGKWYVDTRGTVPTGDPAIPDSDF